MKQQKTMQKNGKKMKQHKQKTKCNSTKSNNKIKQEQKKTKQHKTIVLKITFNSFSNVHFCLFSIKNI